MKNDPIGSLFFLNFILTYFLMTQFLGQTMITLVARTGLGVHWQGWAGVTQRALAVLLIEFYASMQTAMNAAIQQRKGSKAKRRKLCACVCVCVF